MKIISAEVFVTSPSRNFVTLKVTTDEGVVGIGDATLNGRELAVAAYLKEHVAQLLIGKDPHRIEDTWQFLYRSSYWRRGPVTMAAIAAVDMALWDIKGKLAGMPVYQLLGGASRNGLRAYGHASGADIPQLFDSVREHLELGYKSIRIQTSVPGIKAVYGVAAQTQASGERYDYEPAGRGAHPQEEDWDTRAYLRHLPTVFEAVRNEFGPEIPLLHDGHHRMPPPSRPPSWASPWNRTTFSGSRTARWPLVKSSTRSTTTRPSSRNSSLTTSVQPPPTLAAFHR